MGEGNLPLLPGVAQRSYLAIAALAFLLGELCLQLLDAGFYLVKSGRDLRHR